MERGTKRETLPLLLEDLDDDELVTILILEFN